MTEELKILKTNLETHTTSCSPLIDTKQHNHLFKQQLRPILDLFPGNDFFTLTQKLKTQFLNQPRFYRSLNFKLTNTDTYHSNPLHKTARFVERLWKFGNSSSVNPSDRVKQAMADFGKFICSNQKDLLDIHNITLEVSQALYNNGLSFNTVKQLIKVYHSYLHTWQNLANEVLQEKSSTDLQCAKLKYDIRTKLRQTEFLKIKDQLITHNPSLDTKIFTIQSVKEDLKLISKSPGSQQSKDSILNLYFLAQILLILAKIPMMAGICSSYRKLFPQIVPKKLPEKYQNLIFHTLILRVRLFDAERLKNQLSLLKCQSIKTVDDKQKIATHVLQLYDLYKTTIERFLLPNSNPFFNKVTINPFLGIGSLLMEHKDVFLEKGNTFENCLIETNRFLDVFTARCSKRESIKQGELILFKIKSALLDLN